MQIKPYYLIQAWSNKANKLQTQYVQTEMSEADRCRNLKEAYQRSLQFAASLNESKLGNASDWEFRVRLVNDSGNYLLDPEIILASTRRQDY